MYFLLLLTTIVLSSVAPQLAIWLLLHKCPLNKSVFVCVKVRPGSLWLLIFITLQSAAALNPVSVAVTEWQAASGQDQITFLCPSHQAATGEKQSRVSLHRAVTSKLNWFAVDQSTWRQEAEDCIQILSPFSSALFVQSGLLSLPATGRHAKQHATANLVSCAGSSWHQRRHVLGYIHVTHHALEHLLETCYIA